MIECLTLIQAIKEGIFTRPVYVNSVYDVDTIFEDVEHRINSALMPDASRSSLYSMLDKVKLDWNNQEGVDAIIEKYIDEYLPHESNPKFLVFMSNISELKRFRESVVSWFKAKRIRSRVYAYDLHSQGEANDAKTLKRFSNPKRNAIDLLFSVNKINEGVHLEGVSGIVMLRSTMSPIICYQQIGRSLSAGMTNRPLIFDFVNNVSAVKIVERMLIDDTDTGKPFSKPLPNRKGAFQGINYTTVTMHSEVQDFVAAFEKNFLSLAPRPTIWEGSSDADWLHCLSEVCDYITKYRKVPTPEDHFDMGVWLRHQIVLLKSGELTDWRVSELTSRGMGVKVS